MPKKGNDPKNRMKKVMPNNEWFINVAKSAGFTTAEIIKDLLPNTADNVKWNKPEINKMMAEIRTGHNTRNVFNKQFRNLPAIKASNELLQNMKDDLKSGKFYNKDRLENGDMDDFGFGGMFDDDGPMFIDDDDDGVSFSDDGPSSTPNTIINTMPLAKAINSNTETTVGTMIDIADQQMAVESEKMMYTYKSTNAILNGLNSINENLSTLIAFNSESTAKYHAAAIQYYSESLELLKKASKVDTPEDDWKEYTDPFTSKGNIKFGEYGKIVKKNLKDMKDESGLVGEMFDMLTDPMYIKGFAMNPVAGVINLVSHKLIPGIFRESLGALDKSLNSIFPAVLAKINTFEDSDSALLQKINQIFGHKQKVDYDIKLGEYEKGQIAWDGESKKALVDVIPSYLRRIESALTGDDERVFNYDKGIFQSKTKIKTDFDDSIKEQQLSGFYDYKSKMKDIFSKFDPTYDAMEQFEKDIDEYFVKLAETGKAISPETRNTRWGQTDDFIDNGLFGYDLNRIEMFKKVLKEMGKTDLIQMATTGVNDSRLNTQRLMDNYRKDATKTGLSSLYIDDESVTKKARFKPGDTPGMGGRDAFGLSQLDYLRDIRHALIHGIKVFPDQEPRYSGWRPNLGILKREHEENEEKERRENIERQREEGFKPSWGTNNLQEILDMSEAEWESTLGKNSTRRTKGKIVSTIDMINGKVEDSIYEILYGNGVNKESVKEAIKKAGVKMSGIFGAARGAGAGDSNEPGTSIVASVRGFYHDTVSAFKSYFTGQPYTTSDGIVVEGSPNNLFNKMKGLLTGVADKLGTGENGEPGLLSKFATNFMDGYKEFKVSLFGEKGLSEQEGKETLQELMQTVKPRLPKAIAAGFGGAMVKTFFASQLGLLGSFLLPGGPLGAALVGTTASFVGQSETFKKWLFGDVDENGNRMGGFISKDLQDKIADNKDNIKKSAAVGILSSIALGPLAGTLLGLSTGYLRKNEAFQEFLFGKDYKNDDKKSLMNGYFGRLFKRTAGEDANPRLAAFLGAGGLGVGIAQGVGLLPSMLLPGGPIMGAMLGLAGGIAASSDKFQEFLLGEKDVDGQRYGGLLTKVTNWFDVSFTQPLKIKMTEINDKIYGFMRKKIFDPIARSFEPIVVGMKNIAIDIKNAVVDSFQRITEPVVSAFKENIIDPVADALKKTILNPIKWIFKTTFGLLGKSLVSIVSSPLNLISGVGHVFDMYNARAEIRHEKRNRGKEYDKAHKADGTWNAKDRKKAQKMTKEEKDQLIKEKLQYRDGKTWRQRKKEQKGVLKDEMAERKEKLDKMKQQYEEDKQFAKESGFKFSSKKQKERREEELKAKAQWMQQQQLLQAQETDDKVGKIADNVVNLSDYQDRSISKLDKIENTIRDGINRLADKFDFKPLEEKEETPTVVEPEVITPQQPQSVEEENKPKKPATLKDAFEELKGEFKDLVKDIKESKKTKESVSDKVVDLNSVRKKLRDDDQSHADGLDNVPSDGYLAELHEGEMVVPEKPAGKLRQMMNKAGKGFKGLTDILAETSEADLDHREDENGPVEENLLKGTIKGLRGIAGMMRGTASMFSKVGGMMFGMSKAERRDREDNAMQLTDMEADRLKEMEDKARYEHASRKDVDYIQEKIAARNKEEADAKWKQSLLNAIKGVGRATAAGVGAGKNLFEMLKEGIGSVLGGMGNFGGILSSLAASLALPFGIESLIKMGDDFINSEEYQEGYTDIDADGDGEGDKIANNWDIQKWRTRISSRKAYFKPFQIAKQRIYDPLKDFGGKVVKNAKSIGGKTSKKLKTIGGKVKSSKLYNKIFKKGSAEAGEGVIDFASKKAAKEGMEAGSKRVFKEVAEDGTGKVINLAEQKLMKNAANGSGKAVSKVVGEGVESAAGKKGMITTIISKAKEGVEYLAKLAVEKFPKLKGLGAKLLKLVDPVLTLIAKNSDNVLLKFGKKIATTLGKATAGAATGFVLDAVLAVGDLATGLTAGNAGNLFGVSTENVDARMRIISSIFQAFFNFSYISIVSLVNEITNAMFNFNFIRQLAIGLYNLTGGKADFSSRITSEQIDSCSSIEEALQLMGITSDYETDMLKDGDGNWKDFSSCKNEEFVGVITEAEQMELARLQYNLANGTKISAQGWVDKESETFGSKALKWTKKLFTKDTAQQKYNKLTNKAEKRATKAEEYRKKASESTNIFSKGWNSGMAWVNDKLSKRATKKAEKTKIKAATKKAKAEEKLDYHTQKAANATGISKWYHNWRANANKKKVERYTMDGDKVVPQQNLAEGGTPSTEMSYAQQHIIPKEVILREYDLAEGDTLTDVYGNMYDHTGACIFSPDDHAGMGDGEPEEQIIAPVQQEEPKKKKSGLLSKSVKALLKATPGTAALATLFGKNKKAKDYRMVPIMDENGNIVSYQSKLIKDTTKIEGYDKTNVKVDKMGKNAEVIPQTDEKGNVISYTTVEKNKSKGFLGKLASGIGSIFGLGSSSNSSSVDNSVTTTTSGDTYNTTNNEIDTSPFGPLTDAINNLVGSQGGDNVDEEGNVKTGGILAAILDPMGYLTKKLTNVGVNLYEEKTGKEVDQEKLNKGLEIFNMLRNPLGYLYSKTKEYVNNEENKGKSWKEIGKNAIEDGKENLNKAWDWTGDKFNKLNNWGNEKVDNVRKWGKEKIDAVNEWGKKQYNKSDDVADIIMGDNKAKANILTTGISTSADMITAIWNKFAPKEAQFAEGEVADFIATMINKMIVKPFQELMDPVSKKWDEAKEAVGNWITEKKDAVVGWFNENIKKPWDKSTEEAKEILKETGEWINEVKDSVVGWYNDKIKEPFKTWASKAGTKVKKMAEDAAKWIGDKKDTIVGWYNDKIKEPFKTWASKAGKKINEMSTAAGNWISDKKDKIADLFKEKIAEPFKTWANRAKGKIEEMKEGAKSWIGGMKDKIVEAFNENIKKPISDALSPITTAVSGAWSSLKSAFEPIAGIFQAIKEKRWGDIAKIVKDTGSEGRKEANADEDNLRSGPKPFEYQTAKNIKPVQHNISSSELLKPINNTNNNTTNKTNNKFVFYNQSDARWGNDKIGNRSMKDAGCGPTSLAMAVSQMTGEQITPDTIAKLGQEHLPGYSQYSLFPSIADKLNMNYTEGKDSNFILRNLKQGIPVVLSGKTNSTGSPFTSEGHVVTASHIKGNMVYIQDPRGEQYSKYYPLNSVMSGLTKGMILTPSRQTDVSGLSSSGVPTGLNLDPALSRQGLGVYGDVGEYQGLNEDMGKTGAGQITMADRVLSYARAFLNNTSKFSYSQPRRLQIDTNKSSSKGCGADCSSFVSHVLSRAGDVNIYGTTSQTFWDSVGTKVSEPQIGDVVCQVGHVGLYSGNGNYIHMSGRKSGIKESKAIQNGNNKHRGYKRVLKNPAQMVDPTVPNANSFLGTVVGTSSGNPVGGGSSGGTTDNTATAAAAVPQIDEMGVFGKLKNIGANYLASIYNGKEVDLFATQTTTPTDGTTPSNGTNPDISGISDTATAVWKFFTGKGYSNHATAGIMGNLQQESSMDPTRKQSGGGPGRGIAQWTVSEGRFKGLEAHAKSKGKDWTDLQSQLEWIDMELAGKDSTTASKLKKYGGLDGFKKATDYKWAVEAFEKSFERAGKPNYANRYKYAQNYYDKMASAGTGPATATSAQAAPTDGSIPSVMNGWKYYQQSDPKWKGDVGGSSVSAGGCGPTSHAMMLTTIFGKEINPLTMTRWGRKNGTWTGAMQWTMPDKVASEFGLNMTTLGANTNGVDKSVLAKVKESIKAGKPVIMTGKGTGPKGSAARTDTPFTPGGHVVLGVGVDGSGNIIINDPRGAGRTKAYTDAGILDVGVGLRGAWAFDTSGGKIPDSITTDGDFTGGGTTPGGDTTGGTAASAPTVDEMGVFGKLKNIGANYLASIYNGKEVDLFAASAPSDSSGGTPGGSLPVGDTTVDETLMLSGQKGFFQALGPSAAAAFNQYHIFPSTTLAQAALESAWGKSRVAKSDKNLFGIKWTGNCAPSITVEKGLNCPGNEQGGARPYNRYKSYADSMTDHGWFLGKYDRYKATLAATTPEEQIRLLGKSGYAEASTYGSSLQNMVDKYNLTQYNTAAGNAGSGDGDGKIHMITPKGDAGKGDGKVSYSKSVNTGVNRADIAAQRNLEAINRKVNVAFNNINASDPNAYAEVLKIILSELQAINANTAATAEGVGHIEIVSANAPIHEDDKQITTADTYKAGKKQKPISKLKTINTSTGYAAARQIAGYKKN